MSSQPARTTDVAALMFEVSDRLLLGPVRGVHQALARRVFGRTGRAGGRASESVHDAFAAPAYATVSSALRLGGLAVRSMSNRGIGTVVEDTETGRRMVSAVNGLIGDQLSAIDERQAIDMSVRAQGRDVAIESDALGQVYANPSHHLAVFIHGLCENDESWDVGPVATETNASAILIRYNTGLPTSHNGRELDLLLRDLTELWPVNVTRITLVGHAMGGLVARAATNHAISDGQTWQHLVRDVVLLGSPHTGARLEKAAGFSSQLLPARRIRSRLHYGHISADEWHGQDLTTRWGADRISAANLPRARYHFLAPPQRRFGGYLPTLSATASLLTNAEVADRLVTWLNAADQATQALASATVR